MKTSRNTNPKREKAFQKYMQEKLAITVLVITLALFALVMVLYNLTKEKNEDYTQIVLSQQSYDSRVIPYRRGNIVDRNGTYLAISEKVYNLILDPKQIMSDEKNYLEATVTALSTYFGYDANELRTLIKEKQDIQYVRYSRKLSLDQKEEFEKLVKETNQANYKNDSQARVKGVWFEDEYRRVYPYNSLACNVIGFSSSDGKLGTGGIEQYYNNTLIGTNGREYGYLNDDSNLERVIKPAENGNTVVSTIDVNVQNIIEKNIEQFEAELGGKTTAVLAMNPNNGEILGMATSHTYDLNNPRDLNGYTDAELTALGEKEAMDDYKRKNNGNKITEDQIYEHYTKEEVLSLGQLVAWNQKWRNFCVSDTYEPGSPSKIFTVAAALEEGLINANSTYVCDGYQEVGGWKIKCSNKYGHGLLTLEQSLMVSCNDAMMQIAAQTGRDRFTKYQRLFGFGSKSGIDLPGEAETSTLLFNADDMGSADLATNSFGQNYNCTMVQLAAAFCSIINGGSYYEPHVVKQVLNEQGAVVNKVEPRLVRETVSESTSDFIKKALDKTVNDPMGTGKGARVVGYEVGGKTGTAEKYPRADKNYLVSFAGFAPADDPQVFLYVVIDTPNLPPGEQQAHSTFASSLFQKIMTQMLPYLNVFPTSEIPEAPPETTKASQPEGSNKPVEESTKPETGESQTATETGGEQETEGETQPAQPQTFPEEEAPAAGTEEGEQELPGKPPGLDNTQPVETIPANPF